MKRTAIMALLLAFAFVFALEAPAASRFKHRNAVVERVDLQNNRVIVGDGYLWLSNRTIVYTSTGAPGSLQMLRKGQTIQFNLDKTAAQPTASEIWITSGN